MRSILIFLLLLGINGYSQKVKPPKHIYSMVPVDSVTYVKQTEVSVSEWLAYVERCFERRLLYVDHGVFLIDTLLPDLNKVHPYSRIIFEMARQSYIVRTYIEFGDDEDFISELYDHFTIDFEFDTCDVKWYPAGVPFYLSAWQYDTYIEKMKLALDLPVTGVSFDQVKFYLRSTERFLDQSKGLKKTSYSISLYLPSASQWEDLVMNNLIRVPGNTDGAFPDSLNTEGPCPLYNYLPWETPCESDSEKVELYGYFLGPVATYSYNPSNQGLYCLFGNVSEMTSTEGVAKGGSYLHYAFECYPQEEQLYYQPEEWLGFRYFGELMYFEDDDE